MYESDFLSIIHSDPDDIVVRLTYADWLAEQGNPRGDFIHFQCELEQLGPYDCRQPLVIQQDHLLRQHGSEWTKGWSDRAGVKIVFRRGFPYRLVIDGERFLEVADELMDCFPTIQGIELSHTSTMLPQIAQSKHLQRIRDLRIMDSYRHTEFTTGLQHLLSSPNLDQLERFTIGPKLLTRSDLINLVDSPILPNLVQLNLSSNRLDSRKAAILGAIQSSCRLRSADFSFCQLGNEGVQLLGQSRLLENATSLNLSHNGVNSEGLAFFAATPFPSSVTRLFLRGRHSTPRLDDAAIRYLGDSYKFRHLELLDLEAQQLTRQAAVYLAAVDFVSNLRSLNLSYNGLRENGLRSLSLVTLKNLRDLSLKRVDCGDFGAIALSSSRYLDNLTQLDLSDNRIGVDGTQALSISPVVSRLHTLDLSGNLFQDRGVEFLTSSPYFKRAQVLSLRNTAVGSAAVRKICQTTNFRFLRSLDLSNNLLNPASVSILGDTDRLPALIHLDLRENYIGAPMAQRLRNGRGMRQVLSLQWEKSVVSAGESMREVPTFY